MALRREKAGLFVSEWRNFTLGQAMHAYQAGFRYIMLKAHSGGRPGWDGTPDTGHPTREYLESLNQIGFDVGGWGAFGDRDTPKECALAAVGSIELNGYSFYVANIEIPFDDKTFVDHFRANKPKFTLWLSSEISNPRDWDTWFGAPGQPVRATAWLPQCYLNVNPSAKAIEALFWATRKDGHGYGIPAEMVKPTVGLYDPRIPVEKYVQDLKATSPGFSVWLGETATRAEIDTLGRAGLAAV